MTDLRQVTTCMASGAGPAAGLRRRWILDARLEIGSSRSQAAPGL